MATPPVFLPELKCNVCQQILKENEADPSRSELYKEIQKHHVGALALIDVWRKYDAKGIKFLYPSLLRHAKKHQAVTEKKRTRAIVKAQEQRITKEAERKLIHHSERRTNLLEWLDDQVQSGAVKPTASAIVALLKQEADIEERQKDRTHEMQKLFASYIANPLPEPKRGYRDIEDDVVIDVEEGEVVEATDSTRSDQ